ncbi:MAG: hypothetical protein AAGF83_09710 [Cyanobacteria bacterium P01_G01_bin.67]
MTKLLEKAIASVRQLSESEQDGITKMILQELEKNKPLLGQILTKLFKKAKSVQVFQIYLINMITILMGKQNKILISYELVLRDY